VFTLTGGHLQGCARTRTRLNLYLAGFPRQGSAYSSSLVLHSPPTSRAGGLQAAYAYKIASNYREFMVDEKLDRTLAIGSKALRGRRDKAAVAVAALARNARLFSPLPLAGKGWHEG